MNNDPDNPLSRFPAYLEALKRMREGGMTYNSQWSAKWFEDVFKHERDSKEFAFSIMSLRQAIEEEDGYYLQQHDDGNAYRIPDADEHGEVAKGMERKMRRYAARCVILRNRTLANPQAVLSDHARATMEREAEIAAVRRIMLRRERQIVSHIKETKPTLLLHREIS